MYGPFIQAANSVRDFPVARVQQYSEQDGLQGDTSELWSFSQGKEVIHWYVIISYAFSSR